jgi:putative FmdB family regulatory protein
VPIYEYECEECGHRMEKIRKFSDEPLKICPNCDKPALRKLVSAAAFRLKGSGWYETDFKTGSKKNVLHGVGGSSGDSAGGGQSGGGDTGGSKADSASKSSDSSSSGSSSGSSSASSTSSTTSKPSSS